MGEGWRLGDHTVQSLGRRWDPGQEQRLPEHKKHSDSEFTLKEKTTEVSNSLDYRKVRKRR